MTPDQSNLFHSEGIAAVLPFPAHRMVGRIRRQGKLLLGWSDDAVLAHLDRVYGATYERLCGLGIAPATAAQEAHALTMAIAAARDGVPPEALEG